MNGSPIQKATLGRLPQYLEYLKTKPQDNHATISATAIAKALSFGEIQVRKDLAQISGAGKPKIGYVMNDLIADIERALGHDRDTDAVLVGAGQLGQALLRYDGFREYGVNIVAAFDQNEARICPEASLPVLPMKDFTAYCKTRGIHLGIITVGEASAQEVCDAMIAAGIKAIWNFAPVRLSIPEGICIIHENLALSLAHLSQQLKNIT